MIARAMTTVAVAAGALLFVQPHAVSGQLTISGEVDLLAASGPDTRGLNRNFHGDGPFSQVRLRLYGQHWVTERIGVFTELLFDIDAEPRVYGAYVVINELGGRSWLNTRIGLAPPALGNFGLRDTYFTANPVIGVPLLWQHRSTLDGSGLARNEDLTRRRERNVIALPLLYAACWNPQWELLGTLGVLEYSVGVMSGSFSNPSAAGEDGVTKFGRVGLEPISGIRFGVSGAVGPYLGGTLRDPLTTATEYPGESEDYLQRTIGYDLEVSYGKWRVFSEGFVSDWEAPLIPERLVSWSGYGEAAVDFAPAWQAAVRVGMSTYSDISSTHDGLGPRTGWDDDVVQVESAISYRIARELLVRAGWQHTRFRTGPETPINLAAIQLKAVF